MAQASTDRGLLQQATAATTHTPPPAAALASNDDHSVSSPPPRAAHLAADDQPPASLLFLPPAPRTLAAETMDSGGAEKGERTVADEGATGAGGVLRPLGGAGAASPVSEIEQAPPSPPRPRSGLIDVDAEVAAAVACGMGMGGLAAEAGPGLACERLKSELRREEAALARLRSQLRRRRGEEEDRRTHTGGAGGAGKGKEKLDDFTVAGVLRPSPAAAANEAQRMEDAAAAAARLRSQLQRPRGAGEGCSYKRPDSARPQRRPEDGTKCLEMEAAAAAAAAGEGGFMPALQRVEHELAVVSDALKEMEAAMNRKKREEYLRARAQRKNKIAHTCNCGHVVSVITLASGLMLLIKFRTSLWPAFLSLVTGAQALLWMLSSIRFFRGWFVTSRNVKGFSRYVALLIYIYFSLVVLYAFYLISRTISGTFAGLLGKRS
ncbi:hypothetical protein ACP4OV_012192 [Aristida adscensionis]